MPLTPTTPPPAGQPLTSGADPGRDTAPHSDTDGLHDHWSDGLNPSQSESEAKPAPGWVNDPFIVGSGGAVDPEAVDRVHAWFHCPRRHPQGLDGACDCGARYGQLSGRERQWMHTGHSDWSCCDD